MPFGTLDGLFALHNGLLVFLHCRPIVYVQLRLYNALFPDLSLARPQHKARWSHLRVWKAPSDSPNLASTPAPGAMCTHIHVRCYAANCYAVSLQHRLGTFLLGSGRRPATDPSCQRLVRCMRVHTGRSARCSSRYRHIPRRKGIGCKCLQRLSEAAAPLTA